MNYVDVLKQLIAIDTTIPPGLNYEKAVDFLQPLFEGLDFNTFREQSYVSKWVHHL